MSQNFDFKGLRTELAKVRGNTRLAVQDLDKEELACFTIGMVDQLTSKLEEISSLLHEANSRTVEMMSIAKQAQESANRAMNAVDLALDLEESTAGEIGPRLKFGKQFYFDVALSPESSLNPAEWKWLTKAFLDYLGECEFPIDFEIKSLWLALPRMKIDFLQSARECLDDLQVKAQEIGN